jgi:hypothetical protein
MLAGNTGTFSTDDRTFSTGVSRWAPADLFNGYRRPVRESRLVDSVPAMSSISTDLFNGAGAMGSFLRTFSTGVHSSFFAPSIWRNIGVTPISDGGEQPVDIGLGQGAGTLRAGIMDGGGQLALTGL